MTGGNAERSEEGGYQEALVLPEAYASLPRCHIAAFFSLSTRKEGSEGRSFVNFTSLTSHDSTTFGYYIWLGTYLSLLLEGEEEEPPKARGIHLGECLLVAHC